MDDRLRMLAELLLRDSDLGRTPRVVIASSRDGDGLVPALVLDEGVEGFDGYHDFDIEDLVEDWETKITALLDEIKEDLRLTALLTDRRAAS